MIRIPKYLNRFFSDRGGRLCLEVMGEKGEIEYPAIMSDQRLLHLSKGLNRNYLNILINGYILHDWTYSSLYDINSKHDLIEHINDGRVLVEVK